MIIKIELPVLLLGEIEVPDDFMSEAGLSETAKNLVYHQLKVAAMNDQNPVNLFGLSGARICLTEARFPVHSRDGLGLASEPAEVIDIAEAAACQEEEEKNAGRFGWGDQKL